MKNVIEENELMAVIASCQRNDADAQRKLYDQYNKLLYVICVRYMKTRDAAHDLLTESFVKIYDKISSFKGDEKAFVAWMKRIVINGAIDAKRNIQYRACVDIDDMEDTDELIGRQCSDDGGMNGVMERDLIEQAMLTLSDTYKETLLLIAVDGYSYAEVADMLNQSVPTIKTRYYRACSQLRDTIRQLDYSTWEKYNAT